MANDIDLDKELLDNLQYFCMFIGYPFSGHSLVGSIIDAHPNAVISHELHVGRLVKKGFPKDKIFSMIILNSIFYARQGRTWNEHSYIIPGEWNGRFSAIKVIGDKQGGTNSKFFTRRSDVLQAIDSALGMPVKYIHVMRNPYDMMSTLYRMTKNPAPDRMKYAIGQIAKQMKRVEKLRQQIDSEHWFDLYHEQLLSSPAETIEALFRFFDLETPAGFAENCKKILYINPHKSRFDIPWRDTDVEFFTSELSQFPWFSCYSFDS